jgi:hypothetical protein
MKKLLIALVLCILTVATSAQVRFTATNGENLKMKKGNTTRTKQKTTKVFFSTDQVTPEYEEIGVMTVKMNDRVEAIDKAKIYGSRATGDAVLLVDAKDQTASQAVGKFFIGGSAFKGHYVFLVYRKKVTEVVSENQ